MEKQLSEINSQLKLKTFEAERLNASMLEMSNLIQQLKSENEMLRKKNDVLTNGYHQTKSESEARIKELETKLQFAEKELKTFEYLKSHTDDLNNIEKIQQLQKENAKLKADLELLLYQQDDISKLKNLLTQIKSKKTGVVLD